LLWNYELSEEKVAQLQAEARERINTDH